MSRNAKPLRYKDYPPQKYPLIRAILNHSGNPSLFSKALGIHPQKVYTWLEQDHEAPPPKYCKDIERLTRGEVTCEELRPDIFGRSSAKTLTVQEKFHKCIGILHDIAAEIGIKQGETDALV